MRQPRFMLAAVIATAAAAAWWTAAARSPAASPIAPRLGDAEACAHYAGIPEAWPERRHAGMRPVASAEHQLGSVHGYPDERPLVTRTLPGYWIDTTETTNAQFAAFVAATGYVTDAERLGGGAVFRAPEQGAAVHQPSDWWRWVDGADWRHPEGAGSSITDRGNRPVVQMTRADAEAYAQWLGRRLPTEAQWEAAARKDMDPARLDGEPLTTEGRLAGNFWQGLFPFEDAAEDGYAGLAPVGCYAANPLGLYDMIGNVWEWTRDTYAGERQAHGTGDAASALPASDTPATEGVIKGGSYLCASNFCVRYRASARHPQQVDLPTSHIGFRTVAGDS